MRPKAKPLPRGQLRPAEAAAYLGCSVRYLHMLTRDGRAVAHRDPTEPADRCYYVQAELRALLPLAKHSATKRHDAAVRGAAKSWVTRRAKAAQERASAALP